MAPSRVMVFLVSPDDRAKVEGHLKDPVWKDAFAIGAASPLDIRRLRAKNLIVQELESGAVRSVDTDAETPGVTANGPRRRASGNAKRSFQRGDPVEPGATVLLETRQPLLDHDLEALSDAGGELLESYANGFYSLRLGEGSAAAVEALPFVRRVRVYDANDSLALRTDDLVTTAVDAALEAAVAAHSPPTVTWDVRLHREADLRDLLLWLGEASIPVLGASGRKARISAARGSPVLSRVAALPAVQRVERYVEPVLWNDCAAEILRVRQPAFTASSFDGQGEIVAIADTGIDETHPDLADRLHTVVALGRNGDASDPHGHGTHVAGSIVGTGAASSGAIKGVAPEAKLYVQSLLDAKGKLGGLPIDLSTLLKPAYDAGARIHSNSWGAVGASTYTVGADELDAFVHEHPDMLVVAAAGNDGRGAQNINAAQGEVDWLSIGSPATAKNVLTVGASRSSRKDGPSQNKTWGQVSPNKFPHAPIAAAPVSGDPDSLAAFSSRGPSDDRRIKPDLVAPGTDILSTRSALAPDDKFLGVDAQRPYGFMQGTSMATPLVSGCAALTRQYYRSVRNHEPTAALVRATLINGTRWLAGADANASSPPAKTPAGNFDQGFGRLDLAMSLPGSVEDVSLAFIDEAGSFAASGDSCRYILNLTGGDWLRLCLAYTDLPGRSLQNNLNLFLQDPFGGAARPGNAQLRHGLGLPDVDNNVEVIRLSPTPDGEYLIQVAATNLLRGPQGFALVVTTNGQMTLSAI